MQRCSTHTRQMRRRQYQTLATGGTEMGHASASRVGDTRHTSAPTVTPRHCNTRGQQLLACSAKPRHAHGNEQQSPTAMHLLPSRPTLNTARPNAQGCSAVPELQHTTVGQTASLQPQGHMVLWPCHVMLGVMWLVAQTCDQGCHTTCSALP
jgi:hypothetical protein